MWFMLICDHAEYKPELPSQLDLPEDWDSPDLKKTAVQKFLYPDEAELPDDFEVRSCFMCKSCLPSLLAH